MSVQPDSQPPFVNITTQVQGGASSVEIESRAKGAPQITVKVYWAGSEEATQAQVDAVSRIAQAEYSRLMRRYAADVA